MSEASEIVEIIIAVPIVLFIAWIFSKIVGGWILILGVLMVAAIVAAIILKLLSGNGHHSF